MAKTLRPYQEEAISAVWKDWEEGKQRVMVVLPTGTGKTVLSAEIMRRHFNQTGKVGMFVAHRSFLVEQAAKTLREFGFSPAEAHQGRRVGPISDSVAGTVQTLSRKVLSIDPGKVGLIVIDEAHRSDAMMYSNMLAKYPSASVLLVTATPDKLFMRKRKGHGGQVASRISYLYPIRKAIEEGYLSRIVARRLRVRVDLRGISPDASGEFDPFTIEERILENLSPLTYAIARETESRSRVIVFAPDRLSAHRIAEQLRWRGRKAKYVAGMGGNNGMPIEVAKAVLGEFHAGLLDTVVCASYLSEGYDHPPIDCVVNAAPTANRWTYAQRAGRGTRIWPGKSDLLLLDFDWQTDQSTRSLVEPIHLFAEWDNDGNELTGVTSSRRKRSLDPDDGEVDILDFLEKERKKELAELSEEERSQLKRKRRNLNLRPDGREYQYDTIEMDSLGVGSALGVKLGYFDRFPWKHKNPATPGQVYRLRNEGVSDPESLTKWGASKLIDAIEKRKASGLASLSEMQRLVSHGFSVTAAQSMTPEEAQSAMESHK